MVGVLPHFKFEPTIPHIPWWWPRLRVLVASARRNDKEFILKELWWMSSCLVAPLKDMWKGFLFLHSGHYQG